MSEVDHERGFFDHPCHAPLFHVLELTLMGEIEVVVQSGSRVNRAAEHFVGISARLTANYVPVHVSHEGFAAAVLDCLHHLAHKNRVHG